MKTKAPQNYFSGIDYQGHNAVTLAEAGYELNQWATYKQWFEHGYQVQKGEHGQPIMVVRDDDDSDKKVIKFYKVFNIAQVKEIVND
jgi:antirestriction protein ArdC